LWKKDSSRAKWNNVKCTACDVNIQYSERSEKNTIPVLLIRWLSFSILYYRIVLQTLTFTSTAGEYKISPVSKNAIFLFKYGESFASTFRKQNMQYKSEFYIAERACKDITQRHQVSFKGTFAA
jgi:hypothetical protein